VVIADHLWELFEEIARSMGSERDALINQAMFVFARANGFLDPYRGSAPFDSKTNPAEYGSEFGTTTPGFEGSSSTPDELSSISPLPLRDPVSLPETGDAFALLAEHETASTPDGHADVSSNGGERPLHPAPYSDEDAAHRKVAEQVLRSAAELEQMIQSRSEPPTPSPLAGAFAPRENGVATPSQGQPGLFIVSEDGHEGQVNGDRFLIGRGKHCDYVIGSGKVSREHAVIIREGPDYFIEDLGSSNGTWFSKQRIKRRKIADGDEYFVCSDKIKLVLR
jgi:hypothetical protein